MIDFKKKLIFLGITTLISAPISACSPQKEAFEAFEQYAFDNAILSNQQSLKAMESARVAYSKSTEIEKAVIQRTSNYEIKDISKRIGVFSSQPALYVNMSLTNPHDSGLHLISDMYLLIEHKEKISRVRFKNSHFRNPKAGATGTQEFTVTLNGGGFTDRKGYGASQDYELSNDANDFSVTGYPVGVTLTKNWEKIEFLSDRTDLNGFRDMSELLKKCNQTLKINNEVIQSSMSKGIKPSDGSPLPKFPDRC